MNTYILGINCAYHESAVALFRIDHTGLHLLTFVEEERFCRIKRAKPALIDNCDVLPLQSMEWALKKANITLEDIAHVATSINPEKRRVKNSQHDHGYPIEEDSFGTFKGEEMFYQSVKNIENNLRDLGFIGQFHFLEHHECHSASAFYASGFSDAVSVVIDGISEFESISVYDCEGSQQQLIDTIDYPHSIGFLWEKLSQFIGFTEYDAGKVMGMAAFGGRRILEDGFQKFAKLTEDSFELDDTIIQFRSKNYEELEKALGIHRSPKSISQLNYNNLIYFDLAATLQDYTEKVMLQVVEKAKKQTNKTRLCLSGGVALNCVANQKVLETNLFEEVFIQPAANDAGTALGAALIIAQQIAPTEVENFKLRTPYTDVAFEEEAYKTVLEENDFISFEQSTDIYTDAAQIIADGGIICWFQGGMEYGPRALGHRSILADARNLYTLQKINDDVKLREIFRPLAPARFKGKSTRLV